MSYQPNPVSELRHFCVKCFADDHGGSWGEVTLPDGASKLPGGWCMNCGACGTLIAIPAWAVKSIREQASWVGKRYYPNAEDHEHTKELRFLRTLTAPSGRRAYQQESSTTNQWTVEQELGNRQTVMVFVTARDEAEALRLAAPLLPYPVPA